MGKFLIAFFVLLSAMASAQKPTLKGGLTDFIKSNTVYPPYSLQNCIQGTVTIGFKLNEKGEVYSSAINTGVGADLDEEALRLVRMSSGKWSVPASHDTSTVLIVPVSFNLDGYGCEKKTKADIVMAINAYNNQEELFNVVQNFYRNKEKGLLKGDDESKILALKAELGVDDEYLTERVEAALKKYQQGDHKAACEALIFVKYLGSDKADQWLAKYCK